jgi:hypothetical protein
MKTEERILIGAESILQVPRTVAVCPYCDGQLTVYFDGFDQQDDGTWAAASLNVECETEPAVESKNWDDWFASHSDMPYVYQLPVDEEIKAWINKNFIFEIENETGDKRK